MQKRSTGHSLFFIGIFHLRNTSDPASSGILSRLKMQSDALVSLSFSRPVRNLRCQEQISARPHTRGGLVPRVSAVEDLENTLQPLVSVLGLVVMVSCVSLSFRLFHELMWVAIRTRRLSLPLSLFPHELLPRPWQKSIHDIWASTRGPLKTRLYLTGDSPDPSILPNPLRTADRSWVLSAPAAGQAARAIPALGA